MKKVSLSLLVATMLVLPLTSIAQAYGSMGGVSKTIIITNPSPVEKTLKDGLQFVVPTYIKQNEGTNLQVQRIKDGKVDLSINGRYNVILTLESQGYSLNFDPYFHEGMATIPVTFAITGTQNVSISVDQLGKQTVTVKVQ